MDFKKLISNQKEIRLKTKNQMKKIVKLLFTFWGIIKGINHIY
jgi:hypothetical protein